MKKTRLAFATFLFFVVPSLSGFAADYWSNGPGFEPTTASDNYRNSAVMITGGTLSSSSGTGVSSLFEQMSTAPLTLISDLPTAGVNTIIIPAKDTSGVIEYVPEGFVQVSTLVVADNWSGSDNSNPNLPAVTPATWGKTGYRGYNSQYVPGVHIATPNIAAGGVGPGTDNTGWYTGGTQLREYMNTQVASSWDLSATAYTETLLNPAAPSGEQGETGYVFDSGRNVYNRAAAVLGMSNGQYPLPASTTDNVGFGSFYNVATVWVNPSDIIHTDVSWGSDNVVVPGDVTYNPGTPKTIIDGGPGWTDEQDLQHAAWPSAQWRDAYDVFPPGIGEYDTYKNWYENWWRMNTETGAFPWTGHGYTEDWAMLYNKDQYDLAVLLTPDSPEWSNLGRGLTEFMMEPGVEYYVTDLQDLPDYLAVPEPSTWALLVLAGTSLGMVVWRKRVSPKG